MKENITDGDSPGKKYSRVFDRLSYQNKVELNEISDYLKRKKLNRLAQQKIMADIADMALDYQNRNEPLEQLFGNSRNAFCDELSDNAPLASVSEKVLAVLRNIAAISLIFSVVTLLVNMFNGYGIYLSDVRALQIAGGALLFMLCFPMVGYRDAIHMPFNVTIPGPTENAAKSRVLPQMILYSVVCIAGVVAYTLLFWIYPDSLFMRGLIEIKLNLLIWVIISAIAFIAFLLGERHTVHKNACRYLYMPTE